MVGTCGIKVHMNKSRYVAYMLMTAAIMDKQKKLCFSNGSVYHCFIQLHAYQL